MKIRELTIKEGKANIIDNYKIVICIFAVCVIIGIITGFISAKTYSPENKIDTSEIEELVVIEKFDQSDKFYYKDVFYTIKAKNDYLNAYVDYFDKVNLSQESRAKIESVEHELNKYQDIVDELVEFYLITPVSVVSDIDITINEVYKLEFQEICDEIAYYENILDEVVRGKYTDFYKYEKQELLSEKIAELRVYKNVVEKKILLAQNSSLYQIQQNNIEANNIINENIINLNGIIKKFNLTMKEISEIENYEIIYNKNLLEEYEEKAGFKGKLNEADVLKNKKDEAIIYAKSIEGLDLRKERFFATFTFFVLFGIVVSLLVGAFYRKERK